MDDVTVAAHELFSDEAAWLAEVPALGLSYFDLFVIVGYLQLALRHPDTIGPSLDRAREIGRQMAGPGRSGMFHFRAAGREPLGRGAGGGPKPGGGMRDW